MREQTEDFFFTRPQTNQQIAVGKRRLPSQIEKIFPDVPKIGLVISTFGSPAYVDLALAIRRQLYPDIPVLVHDDASSQGDALAGICKNYGALFESNSSRLGHEMGDLSAVVGGLRWAKESQLDLLVKMSRRFIPISAWVAGLQLMASTTQYGTFGHICQAYQLPLRTECFGMAVEPWSEPTVAGEIAEFMLKNRQSILVEHYILNYAKKVHEMNCVAARDWESKNVRITPRPVYIGWNFLGVSRKQPSDGYLWHETAPPEKYAEMARQVGLTYPAEAFAGVHSQAGL